MDVSNYLERSTLFLCKVMAVSILENSDFSSIFDLQLLARVKEFCDIYGQRSYTELHHVHQRDEKKPFGLKRLAKVSKPPLSKSLRLNRKLYRCMRYRVIYKSKNVENFYLLNQ